MKKVLLSVLAATAVGACAMFGAWKAIPPPGGCDQCHTHPISNNWVVAYSPATIHDETGTYPWQRPESVRRPESSPLDLKKITEARCFRCHKGPDKVHTEYKGRYHH